MKIRFTIFEWVIFSLLALTLFGTLFWYFMFGTAEIEEQQNVLSSHTQELSSLIGRRHIPSSENTEILKQNVNILNEGLSQVADKLKPENNPLNWFKEVESIDFKQQLLDKVKHLSEAAKSKGVELPPNFFFGFSRYKDANPGKQHTVLLQKQLHVIEILSQLMIDSQVAKIESVSRSHDEDGIVNPFSGPNTKVGVDQVKDSLYVDPHGIYKSYPFQIEFLAETAAFRSVVNGIIKQPIPLIIRVCEVTSKRQISPRKDRLDVAPVPASGAPPPPPPPQATGGVEPPKVIMGDELFVVLMRVDMVEWLGEVKEPVKEPAKKKKGKE